MARQSLEQWIRLALTDPDKDGVCSQMALCHMIGVQPKEIHTTKFSAGKAEPEALAAMFDQKARSYCQDLAGTQTFELVAFYGNRTTPEAWRPFTITPENASNGLMTESPDEKGRTQQMMRHGEALVQQVYRRQQAMDEHSIRLIDQQSRMIMALQNDNHEAFKIFKEMAMEKVMDEHKRKMETLAFERSTAERKKWLSFAPPLVNTLLGREVFPQSTEDTALVEGIAENLKIEDLSKLSGVLPPEMWGPLAARMTKYLENKNKEKEELKMLSPHPDPEGDAAGDVIGERH